jgi:uncharacterized phage-associated protein
MATAIDIAEHLIRLAASGDEPDYLSPLRLQKLLYYVQAWSLVMRKSPMFEDRIEAWANGPVVRKVYRKFSALKFSPIVPNPKEPAPILSQQDSDFVASVWEAYKGYSAIALLRMTHDEAPWNDARKRAGCGPADRSAEEITREEMVQFFSKQAN